MSVTVKYKGSTIAELTENGTKTLKTSGKYCEADIVVENTKDGGAAITDGIVVKARNSDGNPTEIDYYNSTGAIPRLEFGNSRAAGIGSWSAGYITKINLKDNAYTVGRDAFYNCANLTTIDFSKFTEFPNAESGNRGWESQFRGCRGLTIIDAPNLIGGLGCYAFYECKGITTVNMPKINALHGYGTAGRGCFGGCTAMTAASFGSIGHPIETINNAAFGGCTQTGLTITVYTTGAYVDAAVTNIRNGATNATIIIKAAEATTYNGTSYAAGATIITSEVTA